VLLAAHKRSPGVESRQRADATAHVAVAVTYSNRWRRRVALTDGRPRSRDPAVTGGGPDGVRGETSVEFQFAWRIVEVRGTVGGRAAGASSTQSGSSLGHHGGGGGGDGQRGAWAGVQMQCSRASRCQASMHHAKGSSRLGGFACI
jgi:hypothetical protein